MKAALYINSGKLSVRDFAIPVPNNDEILIKVDYCGVCGTDFHIFNGEAPAKNDTILGHEFAGQVVDTGKNVKGFAAGDNVAVNPNIHCGQCKYCKTGRIHLCENLKAIGVTLNGGFAEYCKAPVTQAYKFPKDCPSIYAAFAEPVSCCLHGIEQASININDVVTLIGAGAIGLIMLQLIKLRGAKNIIVIEPDEEKRALASSLGANVVLNPFDINYEKLKNDVIPGGSDITFECAGNELAANEAIQLTGKGGTVVLFGLSPAGKYVKLNLQEIFHKELSIKSSLLNPNTFGTALELITADKIKLNEFSIKNVPLIENDILHLLKGNKDSSILKYMITNN